MVQWAKKISRGVRVPCSPTSRAYVSVTKFEPFDAIIFSYCSAHSRRRSNVFSDVRF